MGKLRSQGKAGNPATSPKAGGATSTTSTKVTRAAGKIVTPKQSPGKITAPTTRASGKAASNPKATGKAGAPTAPSKTREPAAAASPTKPASSVKITRSAGPILTTVVVAHNVDPEVGSANASPTRSTTASAPTKAKEAIPTLVPVMVDTPKVISAPSISSIAKAVAVATATKQAAKSVEKTIKKKPIIKAVKTDPKPKLSLLGGPSDLIATAVSIISKDCGARANSANVTVHKEPARGIITLKILKPKVKLPSVITTTTTTTPAPPAIKQPVVSGESSTAIIQPSPPKKKKKFFSDDKPEIQITQVGPSVHVQKKEKETFSIYKLYQEMRESCIISDRWCIPEPMWDPHTNREVLLCYEVDVLMDGSVRMKRCLKILENFELIVLLDGSDKTHLFKEKHPFIRSSQELLDLIRRVTMVKVCSGIKDCDPAEFDNITVKVIERGGSWYSSECNVEVEKGCLGNICKRCTSLRNTLRRKMKRQFILDTSTSGQIHPANRSLLSSSVKPVMRTVGEALYTNLHNMSATRHIEEMPSPPPPRSTQVLHPELQVYMNSDLKERLEDLATNPPPPITKVEHVVEFDPRTMTKTLKRIHTPVLPQSFRNMMSSLGGGRSAGSKRMKADQNPTYVMGNNGELTLVQTPSGETIQLPEGYVLADEGNPWGDNVVVQKLDGQEDQFIVGEDNSIIVGSNFTLEDGEEYEVIGEAASGEGDSIQVLPLSTNSDIEIIEVDENMIQLVDENSQPEIQPVDSSSDIFKFLQAQSRLHV